MFGKSKCNYLSSRVLDVGSWREGGGRNLIAAPPEMDGKAPEEAGAVLGAAEEPGQSAAADGQLPPSAPPQAKVNGGQQPFLPGVATSFDPSFRGMMPPYVRTAPRSPVAVASLCS